MVEEEIRRLVDLWHKTRSELERDHAMPYDSIERFRAKWASYSAQMTFDRFKAGAVRSYLSKENILLEEKAEATAREKEEQLKEALRMHLMKLTEKTSEKG